MKFVFIARAFGFVLNGFLKDGGISSQVRNEVKAEYKAIVLRSKDIGKKNRLLTSYVFGAYFMAMVRKTGLTPEENLEIIKKGLSTSRVVKMFMGSADSYFDEKNMASRRVWAEETHQRKYENDWVVDIIDIPNGFGMDYTRCGLVELCKDEGCPELAKYMCSLDFLLADVMGVHLERTGTLAEGADKCDFRYTRKG